MIRLKLFIPIIAQVIAILCGGVYVNIISDKIKENQNVFSMLYEVGYWNFLIIICVISLYIQVRYSILSIKYKRETIKNILESACEALTYSNNNWHLRATVLICNYITKTKETVYYTSNFNHSPERSATLPIGFGVTGKAINGRTVVIEELPSNHMDFYDDNVRKYITKEIRFIIAAPIFDPNNDKGKLIGVLAFDSFTGKEDVYYDEIKLKRISQRYADILSKIL